MFPVMLGLGSLLTKVAAAAVVPRIVKALSALGGPPEPIRAHPSQDAPKPVSEFARPPEKALYGQKPLTEHKKQYFGQGEVRGATKLYYATDHLGSIRELVDSAGTVQAEYSYSTYGERTKASGNLDSDWGYAGLWHHQASGLDLATYRAYDAANKRWISRDPLGEGVDYNLYRYCGNSPITRADKRGLLPDDPELEVYPMGGRQLVDFVIKFESLERSPDSYIEYYFQNREDYEFTGTITINLVRKPTHGPVEGCLNVSPDPIVRKFRIRSKSVQQGRVQTIRIDFDLPKLSGTTWLVEADLMGNRVPTISEMLGLEPPVPIRIRYFSEPVSTS